MNETNISNDKEGEPTTAALSGDARGASSTDVNSDLIGFTFSDEVCSEIRVVALCNVNPDRYVIVERVPSHEGVKRWRVPTGVILMIKGPKRKKKLRLAS